MVSGKINAWLVASQHERGISNNDHRGDRNLPARRDLRPGSLRLFHWNQRLLTIVGVIECEVERQDLRESAPSGGRRGLRHMPYFEFWYNAIHPPLVFIVYIHLSPCLYSTPLGIFILFSVFHPLLVS